MKIKAIILAILFLVGGSGFSLDIAKCCSSISSISIGFGSSEETTASSCCKMIKPIKKKSCCSDIVIQTVINPVLAVQKVVKNIFSAGDFILFSPSAQLCNVHLPVVQPYVAFETFDNKYPVPILIQKRLLQI